jgi:hypothetical protein
MSDEATVVRAFELPLQHAPKETWPLIRECWQQSTQLANWCVTQLLRADVVRTPGMDKLPKFADVDLYALMFGRKAEKRGRKDKDKVLPVVASAFAGTEFWAGAALSAVSIMRQVKEKYLQERLAVIWQRSKSPCTYRFPHPWPVHAQGWKAAWLDTSGKPCVRLTLPGGQVEMRLRGGAEFGRQMGLFRQIVSGELPRLQLVIRQQGCSLGCHRPTMPGREPARVMVKMVARLPVRPSPGGRTLTLCTDESAFWVAELDGQPAWVLNADHVRRACDWLAIHETRRQRLAQDRKAERRLNPGADSWRRSLERCCDKHARRMNSWLHETAAHLTGYAVRQKVGLVLYRDQQKGFAPLFPWHKLKTLLVDKLRAAGIVCQCGSDESPDPTVLALEPELMEDEACLSSISHNAKAGKRLFRAARRSGPHPAVSTPSATAPTSLSASPSMR